MTIVIFLIAESMEYILFFVLLQRIAKKMLLEEIKANLSSEEDASSDEESDDGKKKKGKQSESRGNQGEHPIEVQSCQICCSFMVCVYVYNQMNSKSFWKLLNPDVFSDE